jgi:hypothetical protein
MALSSDQLHRWSERGDPVHAWYSYKMVAESLTPGRLNGMTCAVYPQGSYANKTNIAADSDVDMVIALRSAFYAHKTQLSPPELVEYHKYYQRAELTWRDFREVVVGALRPDYFLQEGNKAVKVRSGLIRLPADVLIALDYRCYRSFLAFPGQYDDGVQFYGSAGQKIVNYPKRHIRACAQKDNQTAGRYRPVVRIAKNARNALAADDATQIGSGTAPSYFLESLLWNVPDGRYAGGLEQAYRQAVGWLHAHSGQLGGLDLPNGMGALFGDTPDTAWSQSRARAIIEALHRRLNSSAAGRPSASRIASMHASRAPSMSFLSYALPRLTWASSASTGSSQASRICAPACSFVIRTRCS